MPREIDVDTGAEFEAPRLSPILMVQLSFDSGNFRVWTGWGTLLWGEGDAFTDHTDFSDGTGWTDTITAEWYGVGDLGFVGEIEETTEVRAVGVEIGLSGIPTEVLDIALAENWQGRPGYIYLAVLDDQGQLIGEPLLLLGEAQMDQMKLTEGLKAAISLTLESEMIDLERTKARRFTPEQQKSQFPEDLGLDQVAALMGIEIKWGRGF